MPGLPKRPAALNMDVAADGTAVDYFDLGLKALRAFGIIVKIMRIEYGDNMNISEAAHEKR